MRSIIPLEEYLVGLDEGSCFICHAIFAAMMQELMQMSVQELVVQWGALKAVKPTIKGVIFV